MTFAPPVNSFDIGEDINLSLYRADTIARHCRVLLDAGFTAEQARALADPMVDEYLAGRLTFINTESRRVAA